MLPGFERQRSRVVTIKSFTHFLILILINKMKMKNKTNQIKKKSGLDHNADSAT